MKQLVPDWVLATEPGPRTQALRPPPAVAEISADVNLLSEESMLLLLTHLYLELRLNLEDALRAAHADIIMAPKAQNHRLWAEQRR